MSTIAETDCLVHADNSFFPKQYGSSALFNGREIFNIGSMFYSHILMVLYRPTTQEIQPQQNRADCMCIIQRKVCPQMRIKQCYTDTTQTKLPYLPGSSHQELSHSETEKQTCWPRGFSSHMKIKSNNQPHNIRNLKHEIFTIHEGNSREKLSQYQNLWIRFTLGTGRSLFRYLSCDT